MDQITPQGNDEAKRRAAKAEADRRIASGEFSSQEQVDQFMSSQGIKKRTQEPKAAPTGILSRAKKAYTDEMKRDIADVVSVFTAIPGAEEVGGAVTGILPGGMGYQQGRQFVARKREEARGQMSPARFAATSAIPSVAAGIATGGGSLLRNAATSAAFEGAKGFLGANSQADETEAPTLGERVYAGAKSGIFAGGASAATEGLLGVPAQLGRGLVRVGAKLSYGGPLIDYVVGKAGSAKQAVARKASTALNETVAPFLEKAESALPAGIASRVGDFAPSNIARALAKATEPMDIQKISRLGEESLPGRAGSGAIGSLRESAEKAAEAASRTESQLAETRASIPRVEKELTQRGKAAQERALEVQKQRAQTTMNQLRASADAEISALRTPKENANKLRETVADSMKERAKASYKVLEDFGPLQTVDPATGNVVPPVRLYQMMRRSGLMGDLEAAAGAKRKRIFDERNALAGGDINTPIPEPRLQTYTLGRRNNPATGEVEDDVVPAIDLEMLDEMRQNVNERINGYFSGAETGLAPKRGKKLLTDIDNIEKMFLDAMPKEARAAVIAARAPYRADMVTLQAIRDGLNLFNFSSMSPAKLLKSGKTDISKLEQDLAELYTSPEAKAGFQVGARQAIANMAKQSSDDAVVIAKKLIGTETARKRTEMAFGQEVVQSLSQYLPEQMKRTAAAFAGPSGTRAARIPAITQSAIAQRTKPLQEEASQLAEILSGQQRRATQLTELSDLPFSQILAGRGGQEAETFANITSAKIAGQGSKIVPDVFGSVLQSEIAKMTPQAALARLLEAEKNPAIMSQMGPQIKSLISQIRQPSKAASNLKVARQMLVGEKAASATTRR